MVPIETRELEPFGLVVKVPEGTPWDALDEAQIEAWIAQHRVLVLRGVRPFAKAELPPAARRLGPLQAWSFGSVNELKVDAAKKNYLFTDRSVPLHYDGAFAGRVPHYLFFHCLRAPDAAAGGETTFVDTTRVWSGVDEPTRDRLRSLTFRYETERVVHYGGSFVAPVVAQHPATNQTVLRFAEPVDDLNPVRVRAEGLDPLQSAKMITELRERLTRPEVTLAHQWQDNDVVIADNHALLHGRRAFLASSPRHIRRVNVHDWAKGGLLDTLRDSIRIRRPEFMVAEIPILLVAALLVTGSWGALWSPVFGVLCGLFFLLFHFGDMTNCLADRELDAVYKTHLSEAVLRLGVGHVKWQIAITAGLALAAGALLSSWTAQWDIAALVALGLALGAAYSFAPVRLKGRGILQIPTLWAVIFVGPMLLVLRTLSPSLSPVLAVLAGCYGAMQQGTILVNTAEDLPEDVEAGIRTSAVAMGLHRTLAVAFGMVALGGAGVMGTLAWMMLRGGVTLWALAPLGVAWSWVLYELAVTSSDVRRAKDERAAIEALRPRARRMPFWITATAWGTLLAAIATRNGWLV